MPRTLLSTSAVAIAVLALGAACGGDDGGDSASDESTSTDAPVSLDGTISNEGTEDIGDGTTLDLAAADFSFAPTFAMATPGAEITVSVENVGDVDHTFTVDSQDVDVEVAPGDSAEATVTLPDAEALRFYCRFHESQGMQGALYSQDGQPVAGRSNQPADTGSPDGFGY